MDKFFETLMAENSAALFRLAGGFTNTTADRDDLFQELVLAIWQALPGFRGESSARTFLFRIAHEGVLELLYRRSRAILRSLQFGWILGVAQILVCSIWVYREVNRGAPLWVWPFVTLKIGLPMWFLAVVYVRKLTSDWISFD